MYHLGVDIGGTKVEVIVLKSQLQKTNPSRPFDSNKKDHYIHFINADRNHFLGKVLIRERVPTQREKGYEHIVDITANLIKSCLDKIDLKVNQLTSIGIGLPGSVNPSTGIMVRGNTAAFINQNFKNDLSLKLSLAKEVSIYIENDANCFALAEVRCGVGLQYYKENKVSFNEQKAIGIILGTGCGGGAVLNGQIYRGKHGGGLEIGHTMLIMDGVSCYCGRRGCAENYLSGKGIERIYQEQIQGVENQKNSMMLSAPQIFKSTTIEKDIVAKQLLEKYRHYLQEFLLNLTNTFDPDYFVLGGGVSNDDIIYDGLNEFLATNSFVPESAPTVFKNSLGDSAGVIGAAFLGI